MAVRRPPRKSLPQEFSPPANSRFPGRAADGFREQTSISHAHILRPPLPRGTLRRPDSPTLGRQAVSTPTLRPGLLRANTVAEQVFTAATRGNLRQASSRNSDLHRLDALSPPATARDNNDGRGPGAPGAEPPEPAEAQPPPLRKGPTQTSSSWPPLSPSLIEAYQLDGPVGSGAFGTVWRATHLESGELVAIKVIERNKQLIEDFRVELNEAEILKTLAHPNIVRLKELAAEPTGSAAYLVMELVDGGHLQSRLDRDGAYNDAQASEIFKQVASAVSYLHERNITHRDIKPENILFVRDAGLTVKLTDFGLSTMKGGRLTTFCGTPSYCGARASAATQQERLCMGLGKRRQQAVLGAPCVNVILSLSLAAALVRRPLPPISHSLTPLLRRHLPPLSPCAAPELLLGDGYGKAVDMWSLGVLAFALCAHLPPISTTSAARAFPPGRASRAAALRPAA